LSQTVCYDHAMANDEHVALLKQGVNDWNAWRQENESIEIDLSFADLRGADLSFADLRGAILSGADLREAHLREAHLRGVDLRGAILIWADLREAHLREADLRGAHLSGADLRGAHLRGAHLSGAILIWADLREAHLREADLSFVDLRMADLSFADLREAHLREADLREAHLREADLREAHLRGADLNGVILTGAQLVETNMKNANLTGCHVYGVSTWNLTLEGTTQKDLIITREGEPVITVDNLEVAQFIYLLLHNEKIRDVIDTITSKAVLILGRFTPERKALLEALREELRHRNYLPILFDFDKPKSKDVTGTVETLARMARFIIADLTDPSSIPPELATIVPSLRTTPVLPLRLAGSGGSSMFEDYRAYPWVLQTHEYQDSQSLILALPAIIAPADKMADELRSRS
jgi:uncharacterized protein YjbI with pentapeptide repeats